MAEGIASTYANEIAEYVVGKGAPTSIAACWVKLHTGAVGASGTGNPATETTRVAATFGAASGGAITNSADIDWTGVAATETITHVSLWDASTAGNFIASIALAASASLSAGGDLTIAAGDLDLNVTVVAS
jgi:hypothetical protein